MDYFFKCEKKENLRAIMSYYYFNKWSKTVAFNEYSWAY